ncbi:MAG TPA: heparan-alpha-glucosaminide N-acetyltransferase domain-containing protein [Phenylobacterium sp.]|jgi:predicted acyltransferase|uniref:acyltransferase family protein n=1 Tax=Phenylobacterium sp. TaxID=1871053 RepID=UPI002D6265C2|nr:heparan-alpha-glucosaminide N-acetyltransferase domain-containing protein [Phenylobacterium sp.]HZZ68238.1 heparan-alpha-glucosaminide N-acetyltransferase domain-containing protein [Phenylobacterium sp.]
MASPLDTQAPSRFLSLDVFRGLAVALMIVVNTPGPGAHPYAILIHAKWFGFTAADWVFPSFLFAVGSAMAFAFSRPTTHAAFALKVLRRAALIFVLGFLMYWYPFVHRDGGAWSLSPFADTRVMGVLQRIALCYALGAFAVRYLTIRKLIALSVLLLLGYWAILVAFDPADPFAKLGNAGTHLDLWVFGQSHLYRKDGGFDPEGLLGTLPATVNVIAGYLAARVLKDSPDRRRALARMALAGLVLALAGLAWSPVFPIAKKLWTGSFVLLTVGQDLALLAALAAVLEGRAPNPATRFFQVFGRNPLVIYLFSELFVTTLRQFQVAPDVDLYDWVGINLFQAIAPGPFGSLLCAIAYTLVCWSLGYVLDRRNIVVRL